ncbi:hypothetical protein [Gelatiniphilus marinus]|uniref:Glycine dehydrogenase n=1 Tax=Gelatiniphilus marinus TaxID=1759464 RepID=A0ABW5JRK0_9FLAO
MKIMMPCDKANHVCDKTQYKEATLWELIKLNIHLLYCRACRKYTKNNTLLTKKIKESKIECLDNTRKASMKKNLDKAISQHLN